MKFKVGDRIRRISNPVSTCEVVLADPVCALYNISGMPRAGYAVVYPDGTKSWDVTEHIEEEFELDKQMVHIVEELNQWNEHKILLVTGSLAAAQDLMSERLKDYNEPYQPGYVDTSIGDDYGPPRLAEDWQYHPVYPEYWKNGKGHYLKLSTYKV